MNDLRINDLLAMDPMDDVFRRFLRPLRMQMADQTPHIDVDVLEQDGSYVLKAEIPGVRKEDIELRIDGNQVTISAERSRESEERKGSRVIRSERQFGRATRSLWLDCPVDDGKAQARYENGVLHLTLPKQATASAKRISIA